MPEFDGRYLCFINSKQDCGTTLQFQAVVTVEMNEWVLMSEDTDSITHWMSLPDPPDHRNHGEDQAKLAMLINFTNQEMGNTVEWNGDHWQWKK